jgi:DNA-binding beta-propeller fold protein YncE
VQLLDARSGAAVHTTTMADAYAVILDRRWGRVIVGAASGVSAFDVRTGATLWTYSGAIQALGDFAVDEQTGRVFVVDRGATSDSGAHLEAGAVVVLDGRSGARRSTVPVGVYPGSLVIDASTGHAVVVDDGGLVRVIDSWSWLPAWLRRCLPFFPPPSGTRMVNGSVSLLDATR